MNEGPRILKREVAKEGVLFFRKNRLARDFGYKQHASKGSA
jgi:hypothetical protein